MANRKKRAAVSCCATGRVRTAMCGHATANCRAAADCHTAASCRATARRRAAAGCRTALSAGCRAVLAGLLVASLLPTVALAAPQQDAAYDAAVEDLRPLVADALALNAQRTFLSENGAVLFLEDEAADPGIAANALLPSAYTAPYTSVKDQGSTGSCWAFGAVASLESARMVQQGISSAGGNELDWSEAQLAYGAFNGQTNDGTLEGCELTTSDNDHMISDEDRYGFDQGGNWMAASAALAAGRGLSNETDVPFNADDRDAMAAAAAANYNLSRVRLDYSKGLPEIAPFVRVNADGTVDRDWKEEALDATKQAIWDTGAVSVLYYADDPGSPYYHVGLENADSESGEGEAVGLNETADSDALASPNALSGAVALDSGVSANLDSDTSSEIGALDVSTDPDASADASDPDAPQAVLPQNYWIHDPDERGFTTNHVVTIIGWDDAYSRWNFAIELCDEDGNKRSYDPEIAQVAQDDDGVSWIVPRIDGAWIIKNSWGETVESSSGETMAMGDGGLFRFSYCEKTLAQPAVMVPDEAPNDQPSYDETYQYDAIMSQQLWQPDVQFSGANVFTASDNQTLDAVGVWVPDDDIEVFIDVRVGLTDPTNPESAEPACSFHQSVECWGWYTIDLPQTVAVDAGQTFSVVVSLLDGDGDRSVPVEAALSLNDDPGFPSMRVYAASGESFLKATGSSVDEEGWVDCQDMGMELGNVCVKAFATERPVDPEEPEDPEEPTEPEDPESPEDPVAPEDPEAPDMPDDSKAPSPEAQSNSRADAAAAASRTSLARTNDPLASAAGTLACVATLSVVACAVGAARLRR